MSNQRLVKQAVLLLQCVINNHLSAENIDIFIKAVREEMVKAEQRALSQQRDGVTVYSTCIDLLDSNVLVVYGG